ncbi:MAG: EAL domain-containing protein [Nitrospirae bacterium]|jgi:EAL domain-containing protein (putative c-di-GMP-specific phosphodiesterase class I)|nr:EAL domain-containing protein [Nitrospirota bacterium]
MEKAFATILGEIREDGGGFYALWKGVRIYSVFQGVYGLAQRRPVGFEALIRGRRPDGSVMNPADLLAGASGLEELVTLDRLFRAVHLHNFVRFRVRGVWIFLNVHPEVAIHGRSHGAFFGHLLSYLGLSPWEVVIEILEAGIGERSDLLEASRYYRSMGCLIAVDDFGAGHSNFDRIWMLRPEIVKLDRMMIAQATRNTDLRRVFPEIVSLIRSSGSLVLAEGVETPEEGSMILETEIDLVQGFLFGLPRTQIGLAPSPALDTAMEEIRFHRSERTDDRDLEYLCRGLLGVSREFRTDNAVLSDALVRSLFGLDSRLIRIFVLDGSGCQIGENLSRSRMTDKGDPRFLPLVETRQADWSRRAYFREAMRRPGEVVVSTPYLSTTGAHLCRTLAICIGDRNGARILCLDLDMTGPRE